MNRNYILLENKALSPYSAERKSARLIIRRQAGRQAKYSIIRAAPRILFLSKTNKITTSNSMESFARGQLSSGPSQTCMASPTSYMLIKKRFLSFFFSFKTYRLLLTFAHCWTSSSRFGTERKLQAYLLLTSTTTTMGGGGACYIILGSWWSNRVLIVEASKKTQKTYFTPAPKNVMKKWNNFSILIQIWYFLPLFCLLASMLFLPNERTDERTRANCIKFEWKGRSEERMV